VFYVSYEYLIPTHPFDISMAKVIVKGGRAERWKGGREFFYKTIIYLLIDKYPGR
jgi:hypothetical protein